MSDSDMQGRRQRLVVRPDVQRRIVADVVSIPLLAFVLSVIVLGVFAVRLNTEAAAARIELPSMLPCMLSALGTVGIGIIALVAQARRFSNRVVGPEVNIRRVIDAALAGDLERRVRLRQDDYVHALADEVNRVLDRLAEVERRAQESSVRSDDADAFDAILPEAVTREIGAATPAS